MARIAFIGLGNMGAGMALNLVKAGHEVLAFDLSAEALDQAEALKAVRAASATEACTGAEVIVTMLPAGRHVEQIYMDAAIPNAAPGALLIDSSTIDVDTARRVADAAAARGLAAVDAPVSGGIAAAAAGTLTFMVGASDEAYARAEPFLQEMGKAVIHAGPNGAGQAAKLCNNMLLGATMVATCEAFALAEKLDVDPHRFFTISSVSSGQSWSMTSYCPVPGVGPTTPADNGYQGGFAAALMLQDLRLSQAAAPSVAAATPMGSKATELYEQLVANGNGEWDFSIILQSLKQDYAV